MLLKLTWIKVLTKLIFFKKEIVMNLSKKMSLVLGLSLVLAFSIVSTSMATDCANAQVVKAGTYSGIGNGIASDNMIAVKCLSDASWGAYAQFYPTLGIGDQALATALTALSLGKSVWIRTAAKTSGSLLTIIYINN